MSEVGFTTNQYKSRTKKGLFFFPYGVFFYKETCKVRSNMIECILYIHILYTYIIYEPGSINSLVLGDGRPPTFNDGNPESLFPIAYYMEMSWELIGAPIAQKKNIDKYP